MAPLGYNLFSLYLEVLKHCLILHVQREDGTAQSKALAVALREAGTVVEIRGFEGRGLKGHAEINRNMGDPAYPATPVVDAWLKRIFDQ